MTVEPIYLFPTSVIKRSYDKPFLNEFEYLKTKIDYREGSDHAFSTSINILELPELKNIKSFIQDTLDYYMKDVLDAVERVKPTISWVNRQPKGTQHSKHCHANSILSGVFYLKTTDSTPITFHNPIPQSQIQIETNKFNPFNALSYQASIADGDVIIFPSTLMHSVSQNYDDEDRYSLAFNTFTLDGAIGSRSRLTFLGTQEQIQNE